MGYQGICARLKRIKKSLNKRTTPLTRTEMMMINNELETIKEKIEEE